MIWLALLCLHAAPRLPPVPATVEIGLWAVARGVPPALAIAVCDQETGGYPESRRDRMVGPGGRGRCGINPISWRHFGRASRAQFERDLLTSRTTNIAVAAWILSWCVGRVGVDRAAGCYNSGPHADEYQRAVDRRLRRLDGRRW